MRDCASGAALNASVVVAFRRVLRDGATLVRPQAAMPVGGAAGSCTVLSSWTSACPSRTASKRPDSWPARDQTGRASWIVASDCGTGRNHGSRASAERGATPSYQDLLNSRPIRRL
jgi:hypothetical protein